MNGHPGRVTIQDTDPNGATRRSPAVDRRGKRLLPRGTEARSSPIRPLCARRHDLAPKPPRLLSRGQADSRCHHSPRPARRPAQAAVSRQTPPAFPNPGCPRSPLTAPARLRQRRRPQEASARAPGRRRVWPRPLPAPRRLAHLFLRLLLLLLPQPLPPQPPEASLPLQQAHLFRIAPRRGEEDPPLAGEGAWRQEGGPAHSGPPCGPVAGGLPAAFTRSDPRLGRRVPRPQLQVPPLGMPGEGRSGPPGPLAWALQSSPTVSVDAREGLWGKALGAEY